MELLNLNVGEYQGPLDVLLSLIQKHKIDIFDIPISLLADQYLAYVAAMEKYNMEISSDFLLMASELTLIKTRMLLPQKPDDEDPRQPLVDALLEHQKAKIAAEFLKSRSEEFFDRFTKDPDESDGVYERLHAVELLTEAFEAMYRRLPGDNEQKVALFEKIENEKYYTVEEKILFVMKFLFDGEFKPFDSLLESSKTKGETVAVFLAILQLVRAGRICIKREDDGSKIELQLFKGKITRSADNE